MSPSLAFVNCSQIVTLRGPARARVGSELEELGVVADGALLVRNGRIKEVGPWAEIELKIPPDAQVVDCQGGLLAPGFVDAHTHLAFGGNRANEFAMRTRGAGYEAIAAAGGGILSTVAATRQASDDALFQAARRHLGWLVAGGTTTVEAKSGYGLTLEQELRILRVYRRLGQETPVEVVPTLLAPHALPVEYVSRPGDYIGEVAIPALERATAEGLAQYVDAFVEEGYFSTADLEPFFARARELRLGMRAHVDQLRCGNGAEWAAAQGAVTADHLEHVGEAGIAALARTGTMPVLLPGSVFALGKTKYPPARAMIEEGLPVVLATDFNPGSSPVSSMAFVMSLACTQMGLSPEEAWTAATLNPAYSLGRGHDRGSLEPGKRADLVLHDVEDYREVPYWVGRNTVRDVFICGQKADLSVSN